MTQATEAAVALLFRCLKAFSPREVVFLFDAPMSHSGILAPCYREALASFGIPGEARTARVPEREFPYERAVLAGSDRALLDQARRWLDLASLAPGFARCPQVCVDFFAFLAPRTWDTVSAVALACQTRPAVLGKIAPMAGSGDGGPRRP
jgi:hypothetical protein